MCSRGDERGSVDRRQEATCGAIECESSILPGRALTESRQSLHVAPDGAWVRLELLRKCVRLAGLLLRHVKSLHGRVDYHVTGRSEFLSHCPKNLRPIVRGVCVEGCAHLVQRRRPRILNRRTYVPAPEASHVLKTPDDVVSAHQTE